MASEDRVAPSVLIRKSALGCGFAVDGAAAAGEDIPLRRKEAQVLFTIYFSIKSSKLFLRAMWLPALLALALVPSPTSPAPGQAHHRITNTPYLATTRRSLLRSALAAAGGGAAAAAATGGGAGSALAFFESPLQLATQSLATGLPKLQGVIRELTELKRLRKKAPIDPEDDAYLFRFSRSVMQPLEMPMAKAVAQLGDEASALSDSFKVARLAVEAACLERSTEKELDALLEAEAALTGVLAAAKAAKLDTTARDDINAFAGTTGFVYNGLFFKK